VDSNSEIQGYNMYPILHFHRKFSSGVTTGLAPNCMLKVQGKIIKYEGYK